MSQQSERRSTFALLGAEVVGHATAERVDELPIASISANPDQPRRDFPPDSLKELADSIKKDGLQQPIIVRETGRPAAPGGSAARQGYELVMGERRLRACQIAGLKTVRAIIRQTADTAMLRLAIIENVHREDLSLMDRAQAFCKLKDQFHNGSVEATAADLKISRSTGFSYNKIGSADPKHQALIVKHGLDVRGSNFLLTMVAKAAKESPDKTEVLEKAIGNGELGISALKRLHDEFFPALTKEDEKPRGPGKGTAKNGAAVKKRGLFWKTDTELGLELLLSRGEERSASYIAAASAALKFFKAAGFKTVRIEL